MDSGNFLLKLRHICALQVSLVLDLHLAQRTRYCFDVWLLLLVLLGSGSCFLWWNCETWGQRWTVRALLLACKEILLESWTARRGGL